MWVSNLVSGDQNGPQRRESVTALSLDPLPSTLQLKLSFTVVIVQRISCYVLIRLFLRHMAGPFSDDDRQFDFPIGLLRTFWNNDIVVWTTQGGGCLEKDDRLFRNLQSAFRGVTCVI